MDTIKSSADISTLFAQGKRSHTPYLTLIVLRNEKQHDPCGRVAFIAGKKLGNAVWRNAAKRRMREICRSNGGPWVGYDVIFLAKSNILKASYSKVHSACASAIEKSELQ
ncbi:MAG TPA: ribonuclease P protein component [Candidatus Aphodovivens excrementavium]|nr:ribonuclease P protein component [Candidatus Aphodovivens excrementavium]